MEAICYDSWYEIWRYIRDEKILHIFLCLNHHTNSIIKNVHRIIIKRSFGRYMINYGNVTHLVINKEASKLLMKKAKIIYLDLWNDYINVTNTLNKYWKYKNKIYIGPNLLSGILYRKLSNKTYKTVISYKIYDKIPMIICKTYHKNFNYNYNILFKLDYPILCLSPDMFKHLVSCGYKKITSYEEYPITNYNIKHEGRYYYYTLKTI